MYWERALLGFHLKNEWCVRSRRTGNQPAKPLGQNVCDSLRREHGSRVRLQSGEPEGRRGATSKLSPRIGRVPGTLRSEEQICCPPTPTPAPVHHIRAPLLPRQPFRQLGSSKLYSNCIKICSLSFCFPPTKYLSEIHSIHLNQR